MKSFKKLLRSMAEDRSEDRADDHEYQADDHRGHADDHADAVKMHRSKADSSKDSAVAKKHKTAADHHEKAREHALDAAHHHNGASDAHREGASGANKATTTADHHSSLHHDASEKAHQHSSNLKESISSIHLEEGKMKRFHDMVEKGMTAEQIAKKLGMPVKGVAEFMKGMKEDLDEDMKPNSDIDSHPAVKDARKQHKDGVWDGNVDRNGNAIVHIKGKPHTVTNTNTAESVGIDAEAYINEGGLWANIHAKRKRIKNGSKEKMKKPGSKGAPTDQDFKDASESVEEGLEQDGPKTKLGKSFGFGIGNKAVDKYRKTKAQQRSDMNKKNDPGAAKKHLALSVVDREKADKKAKSKGTSMNKQWRMKMGYESVDLEEAMADKSSDVYKEYLLLKKRSIADLRKMVGQAQRGAVDLKSYDKQGAISDLLRIKFGSKKVKAGMGLGEGFDNPHPEVSAEQKKKNIERAKKKSKKTLPWQKNYDDRKRKEPGMDEAKKVSDMTPEEKAANDKKRKEYNEYQKSKRNESLDEARSSASDQAAKAGAYNGGKSGDSKGDGKSDLAHRLTGDALQKHRDKRSAEYEADLVKKRAANAARLKSYDESEVNDLTALYINENDISLDQLENMTEEELNELIGKAIGGAFKLGAKAVVGSARLASKGAKRMSTSGRADAANNKAAALEKKKKDRESLTKAKDRVRAAKDALRAKKKL